MVSEENGEDSGTEVTEPATEQVIEVTQLKETTGKLNLIFGLTRTDSAFSFPNTPSLKIFSSIEVSYKSGSLISHVLFLLLYYQIIPWQDIKI